MHLKLQDRCNVTESHLTEFEAKFMIQALYSFRRHIGIVTVQTSKRDFSVFDVSRCF